MGHLYLFKMIHLQHVARDIFQVSLSLICNWNQNNGFDKLCYAEFLFQQSFAGKYTHLSKQSKVDYRIQIMDKYSSYILFKKSLKKFKMASGFLNIINLIQSLQLRFQQKHSATLTLVNLTVSKRKTLHESCFG